MSNFITNLKEERDLKSRISELISASKEIKFLVGFFYFSGIRELYESIINNPDLKIRVLVGLNIDILNHKLVEISDDSLSSDDEKLEDFLISIKKSLNNLNFDTKEFYEQSKFFLKMIENGNLIIRKTYNPNHSKLYIFNLNDTQIGTRNLFITGSSNLTSPGLSTQNEFNVEISDYGIEDAEDYFEKLWDESVKITEVDGIKDKLVDVLQNETLIKDITPFEAYCLILKNYIDFYEYSEPSDSLLEIFKNAGYKPYKYQLDAISQGLKVIEKFNGLIIADVVGLGKSIIAASIANEIGKRGIVVCPPGLIGDNNKETGWRKYLEDFKLTNWEVRSLGDLESTLKLVNTINDFEVIIVDEAHRLRNEDTRDYECLLNICRGKKVILLTATPFNNHPSDILSLIKLFVPTKISNISFDSNVYLQFKNYGNEYDKLSFISKNFNSKDSNKLVKAQNYHNSLFKTPEIDLKKVKLRTEEISKKIRGIIEPITIRRNRLDLLANPQYKEEITELSRFTDPKEWYFELDNDQSNFYDKVIKDYFESFEYGGRFTGAIYRPFEYNKEKELLYKSELNIDENREFQNQRNLYDFMRRHLIKRFESSFGSFKQSCENFIKVSEICLSFIERTNYYILNRQLIEKIYELDIEEIDKKIAEYEIKLKENDQNYIKKQFKYNLKELIRSKDFIEDIKSDMNLFKEIIEELNSLKLLQNDPKIKSLVEHIKKDFKEVSSLSEPEKKIIIFTEYGDTVKYMAPILNLAFPNQVLFCDGELSKTQINELYKNFDASYKDQENKYKILLTTDKLSEGFNLNRAGIVVNYDIPWNPVRVIQRLGRINRISKKLFNELYCINFFPTEKGSEVVKSREIAQNKMFLIHKTLGEDSKVFDISEEPTPAGLFEKLQQNPEKDEIENFRTKIFIEFNKIKESHQNVIDKLESLPPRIKVAKKYLKNQLLVFFKKGGFYIVKKDIDLDEKPNLVTIEEILNDIKCDIDTPNLEWNTDLFWENYQEIVNYKETWDPGTRDVSIEQKAINNLNSLLREDISKENKKYFKAILDDIIHYGTIPEYTLRKIMNLKANKIELIENLIKELGSEKYLNRFKNKIQEEKKDIIITIENKNE